MSIDLTVIDASIQKMEAAGREADAKKLRTLRAQIVETQDDLDAKLGAVSKNKYNPSCCRRKKKKKEN